jgi:DNA-binding NarL/FixJ family response regulator
MRILLADDHAIVRRHVRNILLAQKGWEVCAEAATGREAVALTAKEKPDLVVLDLSMPGLNGMEAARLIHEQFPETEMIVLSMYEPDEVMAQLAGSGVRACVLKTDLEDLVVAIRGVEKSARSSSSTNAASETPQKSRTVSKTHVA